MMCDKTSNLYEGAAIYVKATCNKNHVFEWCSSASIKTPKKEVKEVNLMLVVFSFLSGLHFYQLEVDIANEQ